MFCPFGGSKGLDRPPPWQPTTLTSGLQTRVPRNKFYRRVLLPSSPAVLRDHFLSSLWSTGSCSSLIQHFFRLTFWKNQASAPGGYVTGMLLWTPPDLWPRGRCQEDPRWRSGSVTGMSHYMSHNSGVTVMYNCCWGEEERAVLSMCRRYKHTTWEWAQSKVSAAMFLQFESQKRIRGRSFQPIRVKKQADLTVVIPCMPIPTIQYLCSMCVCVHMCACLCVCERVCQRSTLSVWFTHSSVTETTLSPDPPWHPVYLEPTSSARYNTHTHTVLGSLSEECAGVKIQSVGEGRLNFMTRIIKWWKQFGS